MEGRGGAFALLALLLVGVVGIAFLAGIPQRSTPGGTVACSLIVWVFRTGSNSPTPGGTVTLQASGVSGIISGGLGTQTLSTQGSVGFQASSCAIGSLVYATATGLGGTVTAGTIALQAGGNQLVLYMNSPY